MLTHPTASARKREFTSHGGIELRVVACGSIRAHTLRCTQPHIMCALCVQATLHWLLAPHLCRVPRGALVGNVSTQEKKRERREREGEREKHALGLRKMKSYVQREDGWKVQENRQPHPAPNDLTHKQLSGDQYDPRHAQNRRGGSSGRAAQSRKANASSPHQRPQIVDEAPEEKDVSKNKHKKNKRSKKGPPRPPPPPKPTSTEEH